MKPKSKILINLYGAPSAGKSKTAAGIFYYAKMRGLNAELVREAAKERAWEGKTINKYTQDELLREQFRRELIGLKADLVVTDSPLWVGGFYSDYYFDYKEIATRIEEFEKEKREELGALSFNYYLFRDSPYNPAGRYETEEQSDRIAEAQLSYIMAQGIDPVLITEPDEIRAQLILLKVLKDAGIS